MDKLPNCPTCNSGYTYEDGNLLICPECFHEWEAKDTSKNKDDAKVIKDAIGIPYLAPSCKITINKKGLIMDLVFRIPCPILYIFYFTC
ncbi:MAG: hypothetical protein GX270_14230 [Clostridiaceae bacterium]|jgi:alkylphosphonate utilization operon protein PhnA|nr:hypothetical protein [Clostridiaceae bacterium]